jgi:predicted alternative tryptophan synthase beta-subunit
VLTVGDEVLTPDSSRFWPAEGYEAGRGHPSYDKQFVRDWASGTGWDKSPPAPEVAAGRSQAAYPTGSPGIAISEAVEVAAQSEDTNYSLGSVLSHVCLHQTVIGQESIAQMEMAGEKPDVVIGCVGGWRTACAIRRECKGGTRAGCRRHRAGERENPPLPAGF